MFVRVLTLIFANIFSLHVKWKASVSSAPGPLCTPQCYSLFAERNACVSLRSGPLLFSGVGYKGVYTCLWLWVWALWVKISMYTFLSLFLLSDCKSNGTIIWHGDEDFFLYYCDLWSGWLQFLFQAEDEKNRAQQVSSCYNIQAVEGFSVMWHGQTASRQCNEFFKPFFPLKTRELWLIIVMNLCHTKSVLCHWSDRL